MWAPLPYPVGRWYGCIAPKLYYNQQARVSRQGWILLLIMAMKLWKENGFNKTAWKSYYPKNLAPLEDRVFKV